MRTLAGPSDLVAVVAERLAAHPWARLCAESAVEWAGGVDVGDAVAWRSGHPWVAAPPRAHALGPPAAASAALAAVRQPGDDVVVPRGTPVLAADLGPAQDWTVRMRSAPCLLQPGEGSLGWIDADDEIRALLKVANPHAAVWPGDELGGQWCGAYDGEGLAACAASTVLAAPRSHLSSLTVHPRARRRGLGAAVTAWFVRETLATGAPEAMLAVDAGNDRADRLYDRLGFDAWSMSGHYCPGGYSR